MNTSQIINRIKKTIRDKDPSANAKSVDLKIRAAAIIIAALVVPDRHFVHSLRSGIIYLEIGEYRMRSSIGDLKLLIGSKLFPQCFLPILNR